MSCIKSCPFQLGNLHDTDINLYNILQCHSVGEMLLMCTEITKQYPPLYNREWENKISNLLQKNNTFRALQFNILAEGLSADPKRQPPLANESNNYEISSFGDFNAVENPTIVFNFYQFRRWRLLEEILRNDPDVITLQECDHYFDFFEPILNKIGFIGRFQPKQKSPGVKFGYYSDGVAIFWKVSVFQCVEYGKVMSYATPSPHIIVDLIFIKDRTTQEGAQNLNSNINHVLVVTTHLKAKSSIENENIRLEQMKIILDHVKEYCDNVGTSTSNECDANANNNSIYSMLFMGDFNTDAYDVIKEHSGTDNIEDSEIKALVLPYLLSKQSPQTDMSLWNNLVSAYPLYDKHPFLDTNCYYTTWKIRPRGEVYHTIDYILFNPTSLNVLNRLAPPMWEEISRSKSHCPDISYPSDHIAQCVDFQFI